MRCECIIRVICATSMIRLSGCHFQGDLGMAGLNLHRGGFELMVDDPDFAPPFPGSCALSGPKLWQLLFIPVDRQRIWQTCFLAQRALLMLRGLLLWSLLLFRLQTQLVHRHFVWLLAPMFHS